MPRRTMIRLMTVAKTGRLIDTSEICIGSARALRLYRRDRRAVLDLEVSRGHDHVTRAESPGYLHQPVAANAGLDPDHMGDPAFDAVDVSILAARHDGLLWNGQGVGPLLQDHVDAREQSRTEPSVFIVDQCANRQVAAVGVDLGIDCVDLAIECLAGECIDNDVDMLVGADRRQKPLRQSEVDLYRLDVLKVHEVLSGGDVIAHADVAQTGNAGKGCEYPGLLEPYP